MWNNLTNLGMHNTCVGSLVAQWRAFIVRGGGKRVIITQWSLCRSHTHSHNVDHNPYEHFGWVLFQHVLPPR